MGGQSCTPNSAPSAIDAALMRRALYEIVKAHLQHVITAAAINVVRLVAWITKTPRCITCISRFAALAS